MNGKKSRITSHDVAREAGVSQSAVSYILNKSTNVSFSEETKQKVLDAAARLGYQPYAPARSLKMGHSKIVLVVWPGTAVDAGISTLIEVVTERVSPLGYAVVWQIHATLDDTLPANLAPALVLALMDEDDPKTVAGLKRFGAPIVGISGRKWFVHGPRLQVEHLVSRGRRSIVFASASKPSLKTMSDNRLAILRQACDEFGLAEPQVLDCSLPRDDLGDIMRRILASAPAPVGVCAFNDEVAMITLAVLADIKVPVPQQVSVIGHDDNSLAVMTIPALTTIGNSSPHALERLAGKVVSILTGIPNDDKIEFDAVVVVRSST